MNDFVKCAITVFDGLLPEPHNRAVTGLIFVLAHWHAMAKLRMHNDLTLDILEAATVSLGQTLRRFVEKTCPAFDTKELAREYDARMRGHGKKTTRTSRESGNGSSSNNHTALEPETTAPPSTPVMTDDANSAAIAAPTRNDGRLGRRRKTLNLSTFKGHSLGDYVDTIRTYGTTDSYSTEPVRDLLLSLFNY